MSRSKPNRPDGRKHNGRKEGTIVKKQAKVTPAKLNKAKKERIAAYAVNAIIDEFVTEADFWRFCAKESKKSYNHLKLLLEYAYGKPEDQNRQVQAKNTPTIVFMNGDMAKKDETIDITHQEDSDE